MLSKYVYSIHVISPVINSSNEAGQKNYEAGDKPYDEPAKRVSENLETSSTSKQDKRHKSGKKKINSPSSILEIVKCSNKTRRNKSRSRREKKRKRSPSLYPSSSSSSFSSSTESESEIVDKRFKIVPKGEEFKRNLPSGLVDHTNLDIEGYIPDKHIDEKILTENPVRSNL